MMTECSKCGKMCEDKEATCSNCGEELTPQISPTEALENDCYFCISCKHYNAGAEIECMPLAKKWNRTKIEIDMPDTMSCEYYSQKDNI